jgi:hypothetical protein
LSIDGRQLATDHVTRKLTVLQPLQAYVEQLRTGVLSACGEEGMEAKALVMTSPIYVEEATTTASRIAHPNRQLAY